MKGGSTVGDGCCGDGVGAVSGSVLGFGGGGVVVGRIKMRVTGAHIAGCTMF